MDNQNLDQPLQIDTSEDQDILFLNADILVETAAKEASETEQNAGNDGAASATSSPRLRSRTRSSTRSHNRAVMTHLQHSGLGPQAAIPTPVTLLLVT